MSSRAWLMDLDGVVYRGDTVIPGAAEFVAWLQETRQPFLFLTNHSARTPDRFAAKLRSMGMRVGPERVLSSAIVTAEFLKRERPGKRAFVIGEEGLLRALADAGVRCVESSPEMVVAGFDRALTYERLTQATRFLLAGAEFIGTNIDATYPIEGGPAPECGALLASLETASGRKPLVMGKPERFMYEEALRRLGVESSGAVMVGDRLDTDIAGAARAGIASVLVLSGATTRGAAEQSAVRPTHVAADLAACRFLGL